MASAATSVGLSTGGKLFFGGLTVGTGCLGAWQLKRLDEKQALVAERNRQLQSEPTRDLSTDQNEAYRRRLVKGTFRHDKEVLVGPRGAPVGVSIPRQGLSSNSKQVNSSGGAPGPQGYHVLTPLELSKYDTSSGSRKIVWVNRGWVPKTMVPARGRSVDASLAMDWNRPTGPVEITTILSAAESTYLWLYSQPMIH
jgi:cytochrome oxidase assembly protein ShyY1